MAAAVRLPNLRTLVDPLLGTPYQARYCWDLARQLIWEGFEIALDADPGKANTHLMEVWFRGDTRDPLPLVQPWDCFITAEHAAFPMSTHVGLVIDEMTFVHARNAPSGVAIERLQRWKPKLLQIARLRRLL